MKTTPLIIAFLGLSASMLGCGGDAVGRHADIEDLTPPSVYLSGDCHGWCIPEGECLPNHCHQDEQLWLGVTAYDDVGIAEATISVNGVTKPINLDESGFYHEVFPTDTCPDSDEIVCINTVEAIASDLAGNQASDACTIVYYKPYVPHTVILSFFPETTEESKAEIHAGIGAVEVHDMLPSNTYVVVLPDSVTIWEGIDYYKAHSQVDWCVPDRIYCSEP